MVAVALASALAGCSWFSKSKPVGSEPGATQQGIASWYGPGFHGRRTSSGEIYDQFDLTAAHQTLPHGTRVRVTNLTNNRSVLVRINDRGPFVDDRIIDLSYAAARQIEMIGPGTAPVRIEVLGFGWGAEHVPASAPPARAVASVAAPSAPHVEPAAPRAEVAAVSAPLAARYAVQVGAFSDYERARRTQHSLQVQGARAYLALVEEAGMRYYRLRLGPYAQPDEAERTAERINALGYPALIVADRAVWH